MAQLSFGHIRVPILGESSPLDLHVCDDVTIE